MKDQTIRHSLRSAIYTRVSTEQDSSRISIPRWERNNSSQPKVSVQPTPARAGLADGGGDACSSGHSVQLCAPCRKDWLFARKEALVSLADGAASAREPTAPSAAADPGLVLVRGPDRPNL